MNYAALVRRAEKVVKKIEAKTQASSVHIINIGDDYSKLSGLVIILADLTKKTTQKPPPEEISAS